jgi:CheY-like chemotaxis protein
MMFSDKSPNPRTGQLRDGDEPSRKGRELRVLIVEDEFVIALDAQEKVESHGHSVVGVAVSASQALEMVAREKSDIVLMDIRLVGEPDGIRRPSR